MTDSTSANNGCPFCAILGGHEPGKVIARDEERKFALIESLHPESVVHWMAVPYEHVESTEVFERKDRARFLDLVEFAVTHTKAAVEDYPLLERGFTIKTHFGSFETVPHAKLHVLAVE